MNKEIIKAMNKKDKKNSTFKKWWKQNSYKVFRIILFPIWAYVWLKENKIEPWICARNKWDNARAQETLNYYIPRYCDWDNEKKRFYFFDNGYGWSIGLAKKYLKWKDRKFWQYNARGWRGGDMRLYLVKKFELEGFTKEVIDDGGDYNGTEIIFTLKEKMLDNCGDL